MGFIFNPQGGLLLHATGLSVQQQWLDEHLQYMANEWPEGETASSSVSAPVSPCVSPALTICACHPDSHCVCFSLFEEWDCAEYLQIAITVERPTLL